MIKNLSEKALGVILELLNRIWVEGVLPKNWKEAIVIPIRKPEGCFTKAEFRNPG